MSLEDKITELNGRLDAMATAFDNFSKAVLERDIAALGGMPEQKKDEETKPAPKKAAPKKKAEPGQETDKEVTHEDLKQLCLAKVREKKSFKEDLKAYLDTEFGVKKTGDVPDEKVAEAYAKIESGEL